MDDRLASEILATCDSIGYSSEDKDKYYKDPAALECIKDLVLYLRRDDDDHTVRRLLGRTQVLQRDLLSLIKYHSDDLELYDVLLRLLTNLTHPALLLFDEEVPKNKHYLTQYLEIEGYLRSYKAAFVDKLLWKKLTKQLGDVLKLEWDKQMANEKLRLERTLIVLRNILMVPADPSEELRTEDEASLHDRIIMVLHLSGIEDLLLFIASSSATKEWCLHVLEIISLMMREQTGERIAKTQLSRNEDDAAKDLKEFVELREREAALKNIQVGQRVSSSRHSRFLGTFTIKDMKAPSGRDMLCHKVISSTSELNLDASKKRKKIASNRMAVLEPETGRRSTIPVRIVLKAFCSEFLEGAYNSIMKTVKDNIVRERMQEHDETYYLWAIRFFMEFNRFNQFSVGYVSETMSINTFHYVQTLMDNFHSMMVTDKEKIPYWSKRAHTALKTYQELLFTLLWMDKFGDGPVRESARVIKSNVFYLPEYRELCFGLLNTYDPAKLSRVYLKDLVETNHLFLKMLEEYSSSSRRILVKTKGKRKKKSGKGKQTPKKVKVLRNEEELEELWDTEFHDQVLEVVELNESPDPHIIPFDATLETPIEEQRPSAVDRIAVFLHRKKFKEAFALMKASREVWPEDFGDEAEDQVLLLKSFFLNKESLAAVNCAVEEMNEENEQEENEEEEEEEEEEIKITSKEQEFDFYSFVLKYASPKIVCNYGKLFKDWETLEPFALQCVLKMFHRFVFQMGYPALICEASIFRTFQKILLVADHQPNLNEVKKFFYHFWPKFVELCAKDKKMFVEILFWKTAREAGEIQDGTFGSGGGRTNKFTWTADEENELVLLAEEFAADEGKRGKKKLLEWIMERWTGLPKSKKMMMKKLREKGFLPSPAQGRTPRAPKFWQESEIERLRDLHNEFKDSTDIVGDIIEGLPMKRSRKGLIDKMLEIGLIHHKSEVKKKRVKKDEELGGEQTEGTRTFPSSESDDSEKEDDEIRNDDDDDDDEGAADDTLQYGKEVVDAGMLNPVKWVLQSLKQFLEDLIEFGESEEHVPLVPIKSENIVALNESSMKAFLKSLGLQTPGLQETFWRIPGSWNSSIAQKRIELIEELINSSESSTSSNTTRFSKLPEVIDDEEEGSKEEPTSRVVDRKPESPSSSSSEIGESFSKQSPETSPPTLRKSLQRIVVDSDSDNEQVEHSDIENNSPVKGGKPRFVDSDEEEEGSGERAPYSKPKASRVSRIVDSDSDEI